MVVPGSSHPSARPVTGTAKNCFLAPFILWPDLSRMVGERRMTIVARIVDATALHLDCDNVGWSVIMFTTRLRIQIDAAHICKL
jgi:hypothetical protein